MTRRVTAYWLAPVGNGATQMVRLDCGHEMAVLGAKTDQEAIFRTQYQVHKQWFLDCPKCDLIERATNKR